MEKVKTLRVFGCLIDGIINDRKAAYEYMQ
jgi:hypothetical protein